MTGPQNKSRSLWPVLHGSVILPYILKTIWCMDMTGWNNGSVWPDVWPQHKCRSLWLIFHGSVILPYILKIIWWMNMTVWKNGSVLVQYDRMFDLKIKVGHCDLNFTVQWFCPISWRLFDVWTWQFVIMVQHDRTFDLKIKIDHCDLYFTVDLGTLD